MTTVEQEVQEFRIWAGERRLLSMPDGKAPDRIICRAGTGRLRLMSHALPVLISPGMGLTLSSGEVATLSAQTDMVIELEELH